MSAVAQAEGGRQLVRAASSTFAAPKDVEIDGVPLRVSLRPGDRTKTPLVLMNGIGASLETFDPLLTHLDPSIEVLRFDAPGVGGSPAPSIPYRFRSLAHLIGRLCGSLGYDQVDALGISWGGGLAQQFAFSESARCRRLVLVATGTGALMVPGSPKVLARMITPRRYRDPSYLLSIAPDLYGGTVRTNWPELVPLLHSYRSGGQPTGYAFQMLAGMGWTSVPFLPLLRQDTLVLTGDDDPIIPTVNGRILAGLIPKARLEVYQGGHVELVANPGLLAPSINTFLNRP